MTSNENFTLYANDKKNGKWCDIYTMKARYCGLTFDYRAVLGAAEDVFVIWRYN